MSLNYRGQKLFIDNLSIGSGKSGGKRSSKRKSDKNIVNIAI